MDILSKIQVELNAPKNQRNTFGKYNYRSCEDILTGLKPLLDKYEASITLSDDIIVVGERIYVKATARIFFKSEDKKTQYDESTTAFAREPLTQKGMNEAQITGSASSYARKYALNGLFAIDDNKDADTDEHQRNANNRPQPKSKETTIKQQINNVLNLPSVPKADKEKTIEQLKAGSLPINEDTLEKLIAMYGVK